MLNNDIIIYAENITRNYLKMTRGGNVGPAIDMLSEALRRLIDGNIEDVWVRDSVTKVNMLYSACRLLSHPNMDTVLFADIVSRITSDMINYGELNQIINLAQAKIRAFVKNDK